MHGTGDDDPLLWYEGSGLGTRRSLQSDHQGSIVSVADASGAAIAINSYDEYGIPGSGNLGRFQYTGQAWIPELGMYHYKARIYSPTLGRFMQVDPIGYDDQINLYAYVGNDPVNGRDPTGMCEGEYCTMNVFHPELDQQVRPVKEDIGAAAAPAWGIAAAASGAALAAEAVPAIVVTAARVAPGFFTRIWRAITGSGSTGGPGAGKGFSEATKSAAEKAAGGKCVCCTRPTTRSPALEPTRRNTDHNVPRSRGGNNTENNAQNTCQTCNQQKGTGTDKEFRRDLRRGERLRAKDE